MRLSVVGCLLLTATAVGESPSPAEKDRFAFDKDRLYVRNILDLQPLRLEGGDEREPYEDVLLHAHAFSPDELTAAARHDIAWHDMGHKEQAARDQVRFELVHVEGKLKRLKRIDTTARLREAGVADLYEAWIFPRGSRAMEPVCVILSQVPADLTPADDYTPGVPVTTVGYFFKLLEYPSNQPNRTDPERTLFRRAPLLLGQSLSTGAEPRADNASITDLVTLSLVFGGVVLVGVLGLALWLRRSDGGSRRASTNRLRNPYTGPPDPPAESPAAADPI